MIISISGGSGAGKYTMSRKLSEILPNSLLIVGDNYMHESSRKFEKQIFKKLGIENVPDICSYNYYFANLENTKTWISTIEKDVIYNIESEIEKYKKQKDYIIIDWAFLPLCDFFKKCDCTICITADNNIKRVRLTERLLNKDKCVHNRNNTPLSSYKPDMFLNRIKYTDLINHEFNFNYYITNNQTIEDFYNNINQLAKKILMVK